MDHGQQMVVWIVAIVMIASIFKARYRGPYRRRGGHDLDDGQAVGFEVHPAGVRDDLLRVDVKHLRYAPLKGAERLLAIHPVVNRRYGK